MERYVWDGDQVLYEFRAEVPYSTHGTRLEAPRETGGNLYGRVRYGHGLTIDQPVFLWKDGNPLVPHWTFRGLAVGASLPTSGQLATGINWPAKDRGVYFAPDTRVGVTPPSHFLGSLSDGQGSGTGLLYRRNRYFDPGSGQFTQEDPIGLAGGLNLYGYANGDPVNFSDPFGLTACPPNCFGGGGGFGGGGSGGSWGGQEVEGAAGAKSLAWLAGVVAQWDGDDGGPASSSPVPTLSMQKQASHVVGTPQYENRVKQGKPTSGFYDMRSATRYTYEAWAHGKPVPGRQGMKELEFGAPVGVGPRGGTQQRVRVVVDSKNRIHGYPSGPEVP